MRGSRTPGPRGAATPKRAVIAALALALAASAAGCVAAPVTPSPSATLPEGSAGPVAPSPTPTAAPSSPPSPAPSGSTALSTVRPGAPSPTRGPMFDAALEALLPTVVAGEPMVLGSWPASTFISEGHLCSFLCPHEPQILADAAGLAVDDLTVAVAYVDTDDVEVFVIAIRFAGLPEGEVLAVRPRIWDRDHPESPPTMLTDVDAGGIRIAWVTYPPFHFPDGGDYLVVRDDVLIRIVAEPLGADGTVPPAVVEVVHQIGP